MTLKVNNDIFIPRILRRSFNPSFSVYFSLSIIINLSHLTYHSVYISRRILANQTFVEAKSLINFKDNKPI